MWGGRGGEATDRAGGPTGGKTQVCENPKQREIGGLRETEQGDETGNQIEQGQGWNKKTSRNKAKGQNKAKRRNQRRNKATKQHRRRPTPGVSRGRTEDRACEPTRRKTEPCVPARSRVRVPGAQLQAIVTSGCKCMVWLPTCGHVWLSVC